MIGNSRSVYFVCVLWASLEAEFGFSEEDWLKFSWKSAFQSALTLTFCSHILLLNDYNCVFVFQPQTVDEVTVDPVQDDIEIVNEGEGTDAFAVSSQ